MHCAKRVAEAACVIATLLAACAAWAAGPVAPSVKLMLSAPSVTTVEKPAVTVTVSGNAGSATPQGTVRLTSGSYGSPVRTLTGGSFEFNFPARLLAGGRDTLTASYTPAKASAADYKSATGKAVVTVAKVLPTVTVKPDKTSVLALNTLGVTIMVSVPKGDPAPAGTVKLKSGTYASAELAIVRGMARLAVKPGELNAGSDALMATFVPEGESATIYRNASGRATVTVSRVTPTVTVTPGATSVATMQALPVTVTVSVPSGDPAPTGSVTITGGGYTSPPTALNAGQASIQIPAGALAAGSDPLQATYAPDAGSAQIYNARTGTSAAVAVMQASQVTVDLKSSGPAVTNQILGLNMAVWVDPTSTAIAPAFEAAGIKATRWPGGSESDVYHWSTNTACDGGYADTNATFLNFVNDVVAPASLDLALTANYGTNAACTGPGDPTEAAGWITYADAHGATVSHMTVGNEQYGSWETDLHTNKNDAATYAAAVAGDSGYYALIKAADKNVQVGVAVNPGNYPEWDPIVLAGAPYDFVEYHFYPQGPGYESDSYIVQQAAQDLTNNINTIKTELATAKQPNTPIYVGEIGSVYTNPGKQSMSITQALYAGQVLGEMMNDGVARATWWIGFGGCEEEQSNPDPSGGPNFSSSLYGWQKFGGYMVFSDGLPEYGCEDVTPALPQGTLLPTARAFQLFSQVAVNGESVLNATVSGDTTDVRAYAATHSGGTALVLFNDNEIASEAVTLTLTGQSASKGVTLTTYDKAIYDQSKNNVWAGPVTTTLGAQTLPMTITLTPWSMNVVIVE